MIGQFIIICLMIIGICFLPKNSLIDDEGEFKGGMLLLLALILAGIIFCNSLYAMMLYK
jgi:hypothetical protein